MFKEITPEELGIEPFSAIGKQWMLVTAGPVGACNTMTASWGALGVIWGKPSATAYIRQSRYTKQFLDAGELFTLSFLDERYRRALALCGRVSGRDCDKIAEAGLTPYDAGGVAAFDEADTILVCRKQFHQFMDPIGFDVPEVDATWYADKDYHTAYIGSIEHVLVKE